MRRNGVPLAMLTISLVTAACGGVSDTAEMASSTTDVRVSSSTTQSAEATTSTTAATTIATTTTATVVEPVLPVSADCVGLGEAPAAARLTFVAMDRLWQVEPDGSIVCLAEVPDSIEMVDLADWSAVPGDRRAGALQARG